MKRFSLLLYGTRGFSLVELSVVLVLMGLIAGIVLQVNQSAGNGQCEASTKAQLADIQGAIERFVIKNERYPLPASRTAGVEDINFGREAQSSELTNAAGVSYGALPFQALSLAPSYASDCWGNKFSYAVTTAMTTSANPGGYNDPNLFGAIKVNSSATNLLLDGAAFAVISHGKNGNGGVKANYRAAEKKWCALGNAIESENCDASNNVIAAAEFNDGSNAGGKLFDDQVIFKAKSVRPINGLCNTVTINSCLAGTPTDFASTATIPPAPVPTPSPTPAPTPAPDPTPAPAALPPGCGPLSIDYTTCRSGRSAPAQLTCNSGERLDCRPQNCRRTTTDDPVQSCRCVRDAACTPPTPAPAPTPSPTPAPTPTPAPAPGVPCGGVSTWTCLGLNGGTNASCSLPNAACPVPTPPPTPTPPPPTTNACSAGWGPEIMLDADSVFALPGQSHQACANLFRPTIQNRGGCTSGTGGTTPSTTGDVTVCVTRLDGSNANVCRLFGRTCGNTRP